MALQRSGSQDKAAVGLDGALPVVVRGQDAQKCAKGSK